MTSVKLNRPPANQPLDRMRYDAQLERRGVSDVNQDGKIDATDGVDATTLDQLQQAADRSPYGSPETLDADEIKHLPTKPGTVESMLTLLGANSKEESADEAVSAASSALRTAKYQVKRVVDDLEIATDAQSSPERRKTASTELSRHFLRATAGLNEAAERMEKAGQREKIGLASDANANKFEREFGELMDSVSEMRRYNISSDGGWTFYASELRQLPESMETLRVHAEKLLGREITPFHIEVE